MVLELVESQLPLMGKQVIVHFPVLPLISGTAGSFSRLEGVRVDSL